MHLFLSKLLLGGEGLEDIFLKILDVLQESFEGISVVVEEGGEEVVVGRTSQHLDPLPELLGLLAPQELELLLFV